VNTELNDVLGNFVHRTLTFVINQFESRIPELGELDERDRQVKKEIEESAARISGLLDQFELKAALAGIIELARSGNQYLSEREPWHMIKTDRAKTATTLHLASQLVRSLGILLLPFLPETGKQIAKQLNQPEDSSTLRWADAGKLGLEPGHLIGQPKPLFHKVTVPSSSK